MEKNLVQKLLITSNQEFLGQNKGVRIGRHEVYLSMAKLLSFRGTCNRGGAGCIIVKGGRIISIGYAGSPPGHRHCTEIGCEIDPDTGGCISTLHAESNAIAWAAREGISLKGSILYSTLAPCLFCAKIIVTSGVESVIYLDPYRKTDGIDFLKKSGVSQHQYSLCED